MKQLVMQIEDKNGKYLDFGWSKLKTAQGLLKHFIGNRTKGYAESYFTNVYDGQAKFFRIYEYDLDTDNRKLLLDKTIEQVIECCK